MVDETIPTPETEESASEKTPASRRRSGEAIFLGLPCQEDPIFDLDESWEIPSHPIDNLWSPVAIRSTTTNEPPPLGWFDDEDEKTNGSASSADLNDDGSSVETPSERRSDVENA